MPIDVLRFGVGHRRPEGPPGTTGITGRVIHSDGRGLVSELAFGRGARIEAHSNPNTTYFIVIEGGGWTSVGDERIRVAAGEAAVWPADVEHAAWTDYSPMRAFVVEFAGPDDAAMRGIIEGEARALPAGVLPRSVGEGALAPRDVQPPHDPTAGEPR
ncbi:MAG: cupin domain-containing protein [Chloroflexota bacterium]